MNETKSKYKTDNVWYMSNSLWISNTKHWK